LTATPWVLAFVRSLMPWSDIRNAESTVSCDLMCGMPNHHADRRQFLVPSVGFEPTSPCGQWCLRPSRMPFRQPGRVQKQL
jgi:hypothetical protein